MNARPARPVDRGPQRLMTLDGSVVAAGEDPESLVEASGQLRRREHRNARCRELDSQRDTVEAVTDLPDSTRIRGIEREPCSNCFGALLEQLHRLAARDGLELI